MTSFRSRISVAAGGLKGSRIRSGRQAQATLEFVLLLAFFVLPMSILAFGIRRYQLDLFHWISWFLSLPVP